MKKQSYHFVSAALSACVLSLSFAWGQAPATSSNISSDSITGKSEFRLTDLLAQARPHRRTVFSLMPANQAVSVAGPVFAIAPLPAQLNLPVLGSGRPGRLTKWTGSNIIGNSIITEDSQAKIGIGITTPGSKLTVAGIIETTLGGLKFPDGTVQTTAAASGSQSIIHNDTLTGNGTAASPLGVAIPLALDGSVPGTFNPLLSVRNNGDGGDGVFAVGGGGGDNNGGGGVRAFGGDGGSSGGGIGVDATGGSSSNNDGGDGVRGIGGQGSGAGRSGGSGIVGIGGNPSSGAGPGFAGVFLGNVAVDGNLSKGGGSFKIDHPLDPENKYLYHSFIESPDMMNIYNGNVTTDEHGDAVVELPAYFEVLNRDFRYQLTVIGKFAQAIVAEEIKNNRFTIKTNAANVKVSWLVTGIRQDGYANKNRIKVEELKPERERGTFLHPEVFNQPEERGVEWVRNPEMMRRLKERRLEAGQMRK